MTKKRKKSTKTEIKEVIRRLYRLVERYYEEKGIVSSKDTWRHYGNVCIAEDGITGERTCYLTVENGHGGYTDIEGFKKG